MNEVPSHFYKQSGVIPYRVTSRGIEVLLITSLRRKRWIIPKGVVEPGLSAPHSARMEAEEEAGVRGRTLEPAIGSYRHSKWGGVCEIDVFLLLVEDILEEWPEANVRKRRWASCEEATRLVQQDGLKRILSEVPHFLHSLPQPEEE
jgi:8-oxo-dGTP pyrophosphatase MutT (NUDIX family)